MVWLQRVEEILVPVAHLLAQPDRCRWHLRVDERAGNPFELAAARRGRLAIEDGIPHVARQDDPEDVVGALRAEHAVPYVAADAEATPAPGL